MKTLTLLIVVSILYFTQALGQETPSHIQLDENLYAITDVPGGNIAFLVTSEGIVVVDAGNLPRDGEEIVKIIKSVSDQPIKHLILTHLHRDHVNGVAGFPEGITIIAHDNIVENAKKNNDPQLEELLQNTLPQRIAELKKEIEELEAKGSEENIELKKQLDEFTAYFEDAKRIKQVNPDITFDEDYTIELGGEIVELSYPGPGHTSCNIIVKFKNQNIIHMGDLLFNNLSPYSIKDHGADIANWIKILDQINDHEYKTVIPGHGEITDNEGIKTQADYFKVLWEKVKTLKADGLALEEIQKQIDDGSYDGFIYKGQLPNNIALIYEELGE